MNAVNIEEIASDEDLEFLDPPPPPPDNEPFPGPVFSDETKRFFLTLLYSPVYVIFWLIARLVIAFTKVVTVVKNTWFPYNPEKLTCPGCGYKGEKYSDGRSCTVVHVQVEEPKRGMNQHTCLRCQAKFLTDLYSPGKEWLPPVIDPRIARLQQERTRVI